MRSQPGEEAHMLYFGLECHANEKEGALYMNYDSTWLVAASGQICLSFAVCSNFSPDGVRALHVQVKMFAQKQ